MVCFATQLLKNHVQINNSTIHAVVPPTDHFTNLLNLILVWSLHKVYSTSKYNAKFPSKLLITVIFSIVYPSLISITFHFQVKLYQHSKTSVQQPDHNFDSYRSTPSHLILFICWKASTLFQATPIHNKLINGKWAQCILFSTQLQQLNSSMICISINISFCLKSWYITAIKIISQLCSNYYCTSHLLPFFSCMSIFNPNVESFML